MSDGVAVGRWLETALGTRQPGRWQVLARMLRGVRLSGWSENECYGFCRALVCLGQYREPDWRLAFADGGGPGAVLCDLEGRVLPAKTFEAMLAAASSVGVESCADMVHAASFQAAGDDYEAAVVTVDVGCKATAIVDVRTGVVLALDTKDDDGDGDGGGDDDGKAGGDDDDDDDVGVDLGGDGSGWGKPVRGAVGRLVGRGEVVSPSTVVLLDVALARQLRSVPHATVVARAVDADDDGGDVLVRPVSYDQHGTCVVRDESGRALRLVEPSTASVPAAVISADDPTAPWALQTAPQPPVMTRTMNPALVRSALLPDLRVLTEFADTDDALVLRQFRLTEESAAIVLADDRSLGDVLDDVVDDWLLRKPSVGRRERAALKATALDGLVEYLSLWQHGLSVDSLADRVGVVVPADSSSQPVAARADAVAIVDSELCVVRVMLMPPSAAGWLAYEELDEAALVRKVGKRVAVQARHTCCVFDVRRVLLVRACSETGAIVGVARVTFSAEAAVAHLQGLGPVSEVLCRQRRRGPRWFGRLNEVEAAMELWSGLDHHVESHGAITSPPPSLARRATVLWRNATATARATMGAVDATVPVGLARIPFVRVVLILAQNAYRLHTWHDDPRTRGTFSSWLRRALAEAPSPPTSSSSLPLAPVPVLGASAPSSSSDPRPKPQSRKRNRRAWFASVEGSRLRLSQSWGKHEPIRAEKTKWCAVCSSVARTQHGRRMAGRRTVHECDTCNVALCLSANPTDRAGRSCYQLFHLESYVPDKHVIAIKQPSQPQEQPRQQANQN